MSRDASYGPGAVIGFRVHETGTTAHVERIRMQEGASVLAQTLCGRPAALHALGEPFVDRVRNLAPYLTATEAMLSTVEVGVPICGRCRARAPRARRAVARCTPVEELRAATAYLRELAGNATSGPWDLAPGASGLVVSGEVTVGTLDRQGDDELVYAIADPGVVGLLVDWFAGTLEKVSSLRGVGYDRMAEQGLFRTLTPEEVADSVEREAGAALVLARALLRKRDRCAL